MNTSVSGDRTMRSDVHDVTTWKQCNMIRVSAASCDEEIAATGELSTVMPSACVNEIQLFPQTKEI